MKHTHERGGDGPVEDIGKHPLEPPPKQERQGLDQEKGDENWPEDQENADGDRPPTGPVPL